MSGGQQQRVALARALVNRPTVLLLDEPLGALDLKLRKEMQLELKALQREVGITFVYVTHDQEEALTMSDVIVVMRDGRIQQQGGPAELYERPVNRFVADFIGTSNFLPGTIAEFDSANRIATVRTDGGLTIRGRVTDAAHPGPGRRRHRRDPPGTPGGRAGRRASPNTDGWTSVPGRIHQGTYLGDQTEYRVQTDLAGELVVRRQNATGTGPARAWDREIRSWCAGSMRRTWSWWPRSARCPRPRAEEARAMSEDLETTLRRMTETKVNRRGFLERPGLTGAAAAIAACTPGSGSSAAAASTAGQRRSRRERRPERGPERCRGGQLPARRRHRKRAVHVQLERVHHPGQHRDVQGQVRHHQVPVRRL